MPNCSDWLLNGGREVRQEIKEQMQRMWEGDDDDDGGGGDDDSADDCLFSVQAGM